MVIRRRVLGEGACAVHDPVPPIRPQLIARLVAQNRAQQRKRRRPPATTRGLPPRQSRPPTHDQRGQHRQARQDREGGRRDEGQAVDRHEGQDRLGHCAQCRVNGGLKGRDQLGAGGRPSASAILATSIGCVSVPDRAGRAARITSGARPGTRHIAGVIQPARGCSWWAGNRNQVDRENVQPHREGI